MKGALAGMNLKDVNKVEKKEKLRRFLKGIICVPKCVSCGEVLSLERLEDGGNILCDKCRSRWEKEKLRRCDICMRDHSECTCPTEILASSGCGVLVSLVPYESGSSGVVAKTIFRIKNEYDSELTDFLAKELCYRIFSMAYDIGFDNIVVTYAPRTAKAWREKGHDQSEMLAKRLSVHLGTKFFKMIRRSRGFAGEHKQKKLGKDERIRNANSSFAPAKDIGYAEGKCVILVDDVVTTGSSLASCVTILRDAGALSVMCVTVAKTAQKSDKPKIYK